MRCPGFVTALFTSTCQSTVTVPALFWDGERQAVVAGWRHDRTLLASGSFGCAAVVVASEFEPGGDLLLDCRCARS